MPSSYTIEGYDGDWMAPGKEFKLESQTLEMVNEADISVEGLGSRHVIIYSGRITAYVDKEFWWPVKLKVLENFHIYYDVDLDLVETNIPGLKKA